MKMSELEVGEVYVFFRQLQVEDLVSRTEHREEVFERIRERNRGRLVDASKASALRLAIDYPWPELVRGRLEYRDRTAEVLIPSRAIYQRAVDYDAGIKERVRAERAAQGLPPTIEDPVVLSRIARLMVSASDRAEARDRAAAARRAGKGE